MLRGETPYTGSDGINSKYFIFPVSQKCFTFIEMNPRILVQIPNGSDGI